MHILTCLQQRQFRGSEKSCHPEEGKRVQFLSMFNNRFFHSVVQLIKSRIGISLEGSDVKDNNDSAVKHIP